MQPTSSMKRKMLLLCLTVLLTGLTGCRDRADQPELYGLPGVWTLSKISFPGQDYERTYPREGMTYCRIFGRDTTYYDCQLLSTPSGIVIIPAAKGDFDIIYKGNHEFLYFEDGFRRPLTLPDDTTLVIQQRGRIHTFHRNRHMTEKRMTEIRDIIAGDSLNANGEVMRYVLSTSERELQATNHRLTFLLSALVMAVCLILYYLRRLSRHKRQVEQQLAQITEEQAARPPIVAKAFKQAEEDFFQSDYFCRLRQRIAAGETLKPEDWDEMEREIRPVYPDFARRLSGLCKMSDVEHQVCLLIKLRFSPSEMAGVLCKDISTVSSIRSRLYKKVFQQKGRAKEWDEFILSL